MHAHDTNEPVSVSLSLTVYRLLLFAYPPEYRREYGPHMAQVFRDCCLRAFSSGGSPRLLALWLVTALDIVQSVLSEHLQKGFHMSKPRFVQIGAWSLMIGGVALVLGFASEWFSNGPYNPYNYYSRPIDRYLEIGQIILFPTAILLITIGIASLYARYALVSGRFIRISLGLSFSGGLLATICILPLLLTEVESVWIVFTVGLIALFVGLVLFGLAALRGRVMARSNWLPLLAGLYFPAFLLFSWIYEIYTGGWLEVPTLIEVSGILLTGLGLAVIGFVLLGDLPEERALSPI